MSSLRISLITAAAALGLTSIASQQAPKVAPATEKPLITVNALAIGRDNDCEAAAAIDVDNDGTLDLVSGDTWYRNPG